MSVFTIQSKRAKPGRFLTVNTINVCYFEIVFHHANIVAAYDNL